MSSNHERGKAIFNEDKYSKFLLQMIKDHYGLLQKEYISHIKEEFGESISSSKLSRDFRKYNIKRIKEDDRWVYKYVDPDSEPQPKSYVDISGLLTDKYKILKQLKLIKIFTHENCEKRLCHILEEEYGMDKLLYIPAYKCVAVICSSTEKLKEITTDLKAQYK